jgi:phosphoglycolate phosphatase-like HAD superfamily hydrolase
MSKKIKLALFDLDGTLVEFHHEYLFSQAEKLIGELGHKPVHRTEIEDAFSDFEFFRFVEGMAPELFEEKFWRAFDWANFPNSNPIPGAIETLQTFKEQGIHLGLVTARFTPRDHLIEELAHTNLLEHISHIRTKEESGTFWKHDSDGHWTDKRRMILEVCEHFGISPEDTLMVGDIPSDINSAKEAGVKKTVAVTSGGIKEQVLRNSAPDHIFESVEGLFSKIFK